MAFIEIGKTSADYRVILGRHDRITDPGQIPQNSNGILLESSASYPDSIYQQLKGEYKTQTRHTALGSKLEEVAEQNSQQYDQVRELARSNGIPLVAAEPLEKNRFYTSLSEILSDLGFYTTIATYIRPHRIIQHMASLNLGASNEEIDSNSLEFKLAKGYGEWLEQQSAGVSLNTRSRNLFVAQKAEAFAKHLRDSQDERPCLSIIVGAAHTGVIGALQMEEGERLEHIKNNSDIMTHFKIDHLHIGYFVEYNLVQQEWGENTFEDDALKEIFSSK